MLILTQSGFQPIQNNEAIDIYSDPRIEYLRRPKDNTEVWIVQDQSYGLNPNTCKIDIATAPGKKIETLGGRCLSLADNTVVATRDGFKFVKDITLKDKLLISLAKEPYKSDNRNLQWQAGFEAGQEFEGSNTNLYDAVADYQMGFIVGYASKHGHIDFNEKSRSLSVRITCRSKEFLTELMLVLQHLGYFSKIYFMNHNCWRLVLGGFANAKAFIENSTLRNEKFDAAIKSLSEVFATKSYDEVALIESLEEATSIKSNSSAHNLIINGVVVLV